MKSTWFAVVAGTAVSVLACGNTGSPAAATGGGGGGAASGHAGGSGAADAAGSSGTSGTGSGSTVGGAAGGTGSGENGGAGGGPGGRAGGAGEATEGEITPVDPDLTGLVPTSGHWVLLKVPNASGSSITSDVELLDLDSNQMHPANPGGPFDVIGDVSPDGRTYFFSDGDGLKVSSRVIRLSEKGFVPAQSFADYVTSPGAMRVLSWSFDSRFALVSNGSSPATIEVIDVALGKRMHSEPASGHTGAFAAQGYWYFYDASSLAQPRIASLNATGSTEPQLLPPKADHVQFDAQPAWVFYTLGVYPEPTTLHVRALSTGEARDVPVAGSGEQLAGSTYFPAPDESVVALVRKSATESFLRRVYFGDNAKAPSTVSAVAANVDAWTRSSDGNDLIVSYYDEATFDLVRLNPPVRRALPGTRLTPTTIQTYGMAGKHAFYFSPDGLHVASLNDAGELDDTIVSTKATRSCAERYVYSPTSKLAFLEGDGEKLVFVDLSATPPAVVGSITPTAGYQIACPTWADGDTSVATTEYMSGKNPRNAWVMRWQKPGAPETPKLVASAVLSVEALRLR